MDKDQMSIKAKPFTISKILVWKAYRLVKANQGAAGIDNQSIAAFEERLERNLYKIWNQLSSGTYFPPAVKGVAIPKKQGGERILGIPTVADRIAQMTIKLAFEPIVEPIFSENSYGYRPNKSAIDAVGITRERCWKYNWVLEFDIKGLFDNIDHDLLMKAVKTHTDNKWIILYIERWLKASMQMADGTVKPRTCGTPQGGVISPVLSNLFLHYVFDMWMTRNYKNNPWCRYADDGLVHCNSEIEAQQLLQSLNQRFNECKLTLHPTKTKIIYCKDSNRKDEYSNIKFNFLGYEFIGRRSENKATGQIFRNFGPAIGPEAKKSIIATIRKLNIRNRVDLSLEQIAKEINPLLSGWINYYGKFYKTELFELLKRVNNTLAKWLRNKYIKLRYKATESLRIIGEIAEVRKRDLFVHWRFGIRMTTA